MGLHSELDDQKVNALHVEQVSTLSSNKHLDLLDDLDSIEKTQSGKYAWLVATTAGVGGLLFGKCKLFELRKIRD
jgi:SP family myo-inositol transporter-like MFS transporter 13